MKEFFINLLLNNTGVNIYINNKEEEKAMLKWCDDNGIYIGYIEWDCPGNYIYIENREAQLTDDYLINDAETYSKQVRIDFSRIRKYLEVQI